MASTPGPGKAAWARTWPWKHTPEPVQHPGPELGAAAVGPTQADAGPLRAVRRHRPGRSAARRRLAIDHVIGLFRSFWIPYGFAAAEGAYVRYPVDDLLAILALESQRAGSGHHRRGFGNRRAGRAREAGRTRHLVLRPALFRAGQPAGYPPKSLASVSTHDLPTLAGLWSGSDLVEQQRLSLGPSTVEERSFRRAFAGVRRAEARRLDRRGDSESARRAWRRPGRCWWPPRWKTRLRGRAPDIPNTTTGQRPNWSRASPCRSTISTSSRESPSSARVLSAHGPAIARG